MSSIDPLIIIGKYYPRESKAYHFLIHHSRMVTEKALMIAQKAVYLHPDLNYYRLTSKPFCFRYSLTSLMLNMR